jgi:hypothetical protein
MEDWLTQRADRLMAEQPPAPSPVSASTTAPSPEKP